MSSLIDGQFLTLSQAAARLAISKRTLRIHAESGRLVCFNLGTETRKHLRFSPAALDNFILHQRIEEKPRCLSTGLARAPITNMTSNSTVIAFTEVPRPETSAKPKR
ncbi:helix-turn-helix domain-containing protein [Agrobacterium tumefaciens]|uniref:helix-turn-helix domain-containing protein n=1 Tax=Agrobacterium tumefaciens TaxID=358 RepID=UPI003AF545B6